MTCTPSSTSGGLYVLPAGALRRATRETRDRAAEVGSHESALTKELPGDVFGVMVRSTGTELVAQVKEAARVLRETERVWELLARATEGAVVDAERADEHVTTEFRALALRAQEVVW